MSGHRFHVRLLLVLVAAAWTSIAAAQQLPPTLEAARALYDGGKLDEARAMLEDLARAQPGDPGVHLLLGVVERTTGHLGEAIASLERAHALEPESVQAAVELATTLAWHHDLDRAEQLYRQVLARDPANLGALVGLGFALAWQGRLDVARAIFGDLSGANPRSVDAWTGLGFVERAALQRTDAEAAYRQVLDIDPANKDAIAALNELHWDRRTDLRVLGGWGGVPGQAGQAEARVDITHAVGPQLTIAGGYQRYAYGAVFPIAGGLPSAGTRNEDAIDASASWRATERLTIGIESHAFFSDQATRGIARAEIVFAVNPHLSLNAGVRPAFSTVEPHSLLAGSGGVTVSFPRHTSLSFRALYATNTTYEPELTYVGIFEAAPSRRLQIQLMVFNSNSDEQFAFTTVAGTATWLLTPSFGVMATANDRTRTFERAEVLAGIVLRR